MMPLLISAARRANRKDLGSAAPRWEWRSRGHSEWGCMVVEMGDMHCSAGSLSAAAVMLAVDEVVDRLATSHASGAPRLP